MIYFGFVIRNPFWNNRFDLVSNKLIPVTTNKSIEIDITKGSGIIGGSLSITARQDHAGFSFDIDLLGYNLFFIFYDNRHWNNETKSFEINQ